MVSLVPITSISFDLHAKKKNPKSRLQRNKKKAERKAKEKREKAKKEQKKTMELMGRISLVFLWLDYLFPILLDWLDRFRGDTRGYVFWFGLMGEEFRFGYSVWKRRGVVQSGGASSAISFV